MSCWYMNRTLRLTSSTRDLYLTKTKVKRRKRYDIITEGLKRGEGGGEMGGGGGIEIQHSDIA